MDNNHFPGAGVRNNKARKSRDSSLGKSITARWVEDRRSQMVHEKSRESSEQGKAESKPAEMTRRRKNREDYREEGGTGIHSRQDRDAPPQPSGGRGKRRQHSPQQ